MPNLRFQSVRGYPGGWVDAIFSGGGRVTGTLERLFVVSGDALAVLPVDDDGYSATRAGRCHGMGVRRTSSCHMEGGAAAGRREQGPKFINNVMLLLNYVNYIMVLLPLTCLFVNDYSM